MSDILAQIGITKEELIDRIVEKALGITADYRAVGPESWEDIPLSSVVDTKIEKAIGSLIETMSSKIESRINAIMSKKVEEVFTAPFQRVDKWGAKKGEPTTIRDMIFDEANEYWSKQVDRDGKQSSGGYGSETTERAIFYARKVMTDVYDRELVKTVKEMAENLKKRIPATIAEEITATVVRHLK